MKVEIKQLEVIDGRPSWHPVPAEQLVKKSVINYMLATDKQVIAALYQDDQPIAFVSNHVALVDKYRERGLSMHAREVKDLLGATPVPALVAETFGGAVVEIRSLPKEPAQ